MIQNQIYYHISDMIFTDTKGFVLLYPSTSSEFALVFIPATITPARAALVKCHILNPRNKSKYPR